MSNGDSLTFEILKKNLCHMLGIDYKLVNNLFIKQSQNLGGVVLLAYPLLRH